MTCFGWALQHGILAAHICTLKGAKQWYTHTDYGKAAGSVTYSRQIIANMSEMIAVYHVLYRGC